MELKRIGKTFGLVAGMLVLGAGGTAVANAADFRPNKADVLNAAPHADSASWITGISRDGGSQALKLGTVPNDRTHPGYCNAYYSFPKWCNQNLTAVRSIKASFMACGTVNHFGSPRFSLEVMNADGTFPVDDKGHFAGDIIFLDPALCSKAAPGGWRDADFIGNNTGSIMDSRGVKYIGDGHVSAWKKLISDPYYKGKKVYFMYLIQDGSLGANYVDKITLDDACFTKKPAGM